MKKQWVLTEEAFETLLKWLDQDREEAGRKYEQIRIRLIKIFTCRGCFEAEELADEAINRVIVRVGDLVGTYEGNPALYFYGVAQKIQLEYMRRSHRTDPDANLNGSAKNPSAPAPPLPDNTDKDYECLDQCLEEQTPENRRLVLEYYQHEKRGKIDHRRRIADELGIAVNALRIRAYRIRRELQQCVEQCLDQQPAN